MNGSINRKSDLSMILALAPESNAFLIYCIVSNLEFYILLRYSKDNLSLSMCLSSVVILPLLLNEQNIDLYYFGVNFYQFWIMYFSSYIHISSYTENFRLYSSFLENIYVISVYTPLDIKLMSLLNECSTVNRVNPYLLKSYFLAPYASNAQKYNTVITLASCGLKLIVGIIGLRYSSIVFNSLSYSLFIQCLMYPYINSDNITIFYLVCISMYLVDYMSYQIFQNNLYFL